MPSDDTKTPVEVSKEHILQFFSYSHLPPILQQISKPFHDLAYEMMAVLPRNPERTVMLRKILEGKDAAVRAYIAVSMV